MEFKRVCAVYFSPTGGTKTLAERLGTALAGQLGLPLEKWDLTPPGARQAVSVFGPGDLVVVGCPTYAGKVPNKLLPDLQSKLGGGGAAAVAAVTFGNRSYDNSLAELVQTLLTDGFHVVAGAAFACRHAFTDALAPGRPSPADLEQAADFARRMAQGLHRVERLPSPPAVPGRADAPYYVPKGLDGQNARFLRAKPLTRAERCIRCGACAGRCPMGSIDRADPALVSGVCIKCHACVRGCPTGAKYFDDPAFLSHVAMLEANFQAPNSNEFYLPPSF